MKRLLSILLLSLVMTTAAEARPDRDRAARHEARAERRNDMRAERRLRRVEDRPDRVRFAANPSRDRKADQPSKALRPGRGIKPRAKRQGDPRAAPTLPGARSGGYRRGQTIPEEFRGAPMADYGRYRLRRPPPGYSYHRRGNAAYLVSDQTGMVFEVVPLER
jgi:Ni/Co efflux regulator RcnB